MLNPINKTIELADGRTITIETGNSEHNLKHCFMPIIIQEREKEREHG
jgi:hypothetical protein